MNKESFRDRSRREYEQRRAEARLGPAQRTCATLDERAGKEVNVHHHHHHTPPSLPFTLALLEYPPLFFSSRLSKEKKKT